MFQVSVYSPKFDEYAEHDEDVQDYISNIEDTMYGFDVLVYRQFGKTFLSVTDSVHAIESYELFEKFANDLLQAKQVPVDDVLHCLDTVKAGDNEYWDAYGHLKFMTHCSIDADKDDIGKFGKAFVHAHDLMTSIKKIDSFSNMKYPISYAVAYKLSGKTNLTAWINKVIPEAAPNNLRCSAFDVFLDIDTEPCLHDVFAAWLYDHEIVKYLAGSYGVVVDSCVDFLERYSDDRVYLEYLDVLSNSLFTGLLTNENCDNLLQEAQEILAGTVYSQEVNNIYTELKRRSKLCQ